jgi:soluble lytic murein transglycosylase
MFRTAWLERAAGHVAGALASLSRIERDYEASDPYEHARATYWHARLLAERGGDGDAAKALEMWRSLVERYPADYYGLLARARLEEAKPGSAPPWPRIDTSGAPEASGFSYVPGPLVADRHFRAGVLLLRLGRDRAAADELAAADRKALSAGGEPLLLVAELLERAGDHKTATHLIRSLGRTALRQKPDGAALRRRSGATWSGGRLPPGSRPSCSWRSCARRAASTRPSSRAPARSGSRSSWCRRRNPWRRS